MVTLSHKISPVVTLCHKISLKSHSGYFKMHIMIYIIILKNAAYADYFGIILNEDSSRQITEVVVM